MDTHVKRDSDVAVHIIAVIGACKKGFCTGNEYGSCVIFQIGIFDSL